ncbi:Hypothetical protein R9X50_00614500 [Acrodontium crateriforme]|uniref:Mid2 domain-containing protein n=1 Tax=Acrodontium crateriforme TaxID=150365 RepID=A0AAQ3RDH8_9PEZI|nr:Hypothetical protein R9X50_00614500 [Acrodontium crateriforme]
MIPIIWLVLTLSRTWSTINAEPSQPVAESSPATRDEIVADLDYQFPFHKPLWRLASGHQSFRRDDVCTDAFGTGWITSACTPGNTLCCVNENQTYPQCQTYLGKGYCCVESGKGCYIDLESSCNIPGAVSCTQLGPGVDQACCPQYTTCAPGYNATLQYVRCNIQQSALQSLAASTSTISGQPANTASVSEAIVSSTVSTSASSTSSTVYSSSSSTTTPLESSTSSPSSATQSSTNTATSSTSKSLSTGVIAGIAIGSVAAIALLILAAWMLYREHNKRKGQIPNNLTNYNNQDPSFSGYTRDEKTMDRTAGNGVFELDDRQKAQLAAGPMSPTELDTREKVHQPVELASH